MFCACILRVLCCLLSTIRQSLHWQPACVSSRVGAEKALCIWYVPLEKQHRNTTIQAQNTPNTGPKMHNSTPGGEINTIQTVKKSSHALSFSGCRLHWPSRGCRRHQRRIQRGPLIRYSVTDFPSSQYCVYIYPSTTVTPLTGGNLIIICFLKETCGVFLFLLQKV